MKNKSLKQALATFNASVDAQPLEGHVINAVRGGFAPCQVKCGTNSASQCNKNDNAKK